MGVGGCGKARLRRFWPIGEGGSSRLSKWWKRTVERDEKGLAPEQLGGTVGNSEHQARAYVEEGTTEGPNSLTLSTQEPHDISSQAQSGAFQAEKHSGVVGFASIRFDKSKVQIQELIMMQIL